MPPRKAIPRQKRKIAKLQARHARALTIYRAERKLVRLEAAKARREKTDERRQNQSE